MGSPPSRCRWAAGTPGGHIAVQRHAHGGFWLAEEPHLSVSVGRSGALSLLYALSSDAHASRRRYCLCLQLRPRRGAINSHRAGHHDRWSIALSDRNRSNGCDEGKGSEAEVSSQHGGAD